MVMDEIHFLKNPQAQRTKLIIGGKSGVIKNSVYAWGLSGTVMTREPVDLWSIFNAMGKPHLGKYNTWLKYIMHFCHPLRIGARIQAQGAKNIPELKAMLFDTGFALRREKQEVLTELPDVQYRIIPVEGEDYATAQVWERKLGGLTALVSKSLRGVTGDELAEIRRLTGEAKVEGACMYIRELLEAGEKVVVFTWHRSVTESLAKIFKGKCVTYYGGMTSAQKEKNKRAFKEGECDVFIANIESAGTGLDGLQYASAHAVFVEIPWTWVQVDQAVSRLHRMGQKTFVIADIILQRDSVEEYVLSKVFKREKIFSELLTNPRPHTIS
jgi:SWI/SNF-related matrix-associated actin-dependent regulator 1 of chromatin subfamily A